MQARALGVWLAASLGIASTAVADDPQRTAPRDDAVEEVTVTARRRAEDMQKTPVSVTAYTERDIAERGFSRIDDIARYTPNLQLDQAAGSQNAARVQIRGVGTNDPIPTRDPGVGVYIDDVYVARAQGQLLSLLDIERVEVLRGPQGTLYGRNTIGGAVKLVTHKPEDLALGESLIRVGSLNAIETQTMLNIPLAETAALRMALATVSRDGFSKNELTGQDTDDRRLVAGRAQLRIQASEELELLVAGEQSRGHVAGRGGKCRFRSDAVAAQDPFGIVNLASVVLGAHAACDASRALDPHRYLSPVGTSSNDDTWRLASTLTWDTGDFTAKSITAWLRQDTSGSFDISYAPVVIGRARADTERQDQISQEFQLSGRALDDRLVWTSGLYFLYEKVVPGRTDVFVVFDLCQSFGIFCDLSFRSNLSTRTYAPAGYTQATYALSDRLRLTGGLRRSLEDKRFKQFSFKFADANLNPSPNPADTLAVTRSGRFQAWTPHLDVSFDAAPNVLLFATYSKGFKSGGFNGRPSPSQPSTLEPFDQETLHNFELGVKSTWLAEALRVNATLFRGEYDDIQQTILSSDVRTGAFTARVENAAAAVIQGAEIELEAVPLPRLGLHLGIGLIDAFYQDLDFSQPVLDPISGLPLQKDQLDFFNTPRLNASVGASYTLAPMAKLGSATAQAFWRYQSEVTFGPQSSTLEQRPVGLLALRLALALPDGQTELSLWADNVLDRRYLNDGINFEDGFASSLAFYGAPRTFGLELRRRF